MTKQFSLICAVLFQCATATETAEIDRLLSAAISSDGSSEECSFEMASSSGCLSLLQKSSILLQKIKRGSETREDSDQVSTPATRKRALKIEFDPVPAFNAAPSILDVGQHGQQSYGFVEQKFEKFVLLQTDSELESAAEKEKERRMLEAQERQHLHFIRRHLAHMFSWVAFVMDRESLVLVLALVLLLILSALIAGTLSFFFMRHIMRNESLPRRFDRCATRRRRRAQEDVEVAAWAKAASMEPCTPDRVQEMLQAATSTSYDCTFQRPWSSCQVMRIEAAVVGPLDGFELLRAPLTQRACVHYTASVLRMSNSKGGKGLVTVASASGGTDFEVSLLAAPSIRLQIQATDVQTFLMSEGNFAGRQQFSSAPQHWQDFAARQPSADATGVQQVAPMESRVEQDDDTQHEFKECALLVGARVTLLGEFCRDPQGVLSLQPWTVELNTLDQDGLLDGLWSSDSDGSRLFGSRPKELESAVTKVFVCDNRALMQLRPQQAVVQNDDGEKGAVSV